MISRLCFALALLLAAPAMAANSNWEYTPSATLEDVLLLPAESGGYTQNVVTIGTGSLPLHNGMSVIYTTLRVDRSKGGLVTSVYWRCYEYFNVNFSAADTRCFVLKPRAP